MKKTLVLLPLAAALCHCANEAKFPDSALDYCAAQTMRTLTELQPGNYTDSPRNIPPGEWRWNTRDAHSDWTSGFWPGILWYDYEYTGDSAVLGAAENFTGALKSFSERPATNHDLGFLVFCSYGNGYRLTGREDYRQVMLDTAERLAGLYNPNVGTILSWPQEVKRFGGHNTIMDNMMNLELLFWAAKNGGDARLYDIAVTHADTTLKYGFREDGTSYHVAVYDSLSGDFLSGRTHQGYADNSMWARGQAWGIYGYTLCYRYTRDERYLDFAQKIAGVYLDRLPADMIPYWDFDDPAIPDVPRDASAAAITASALLELSGYVQGARGEEFRAAAEKMLRELDANYRGGEQTPSMLIHSTGHKPGDSEIDHAIIYADYYFFEALLRLRRMADGHPATDR